MITFPARVAELLQQPVTEFFFLVKIGSLKFTSWPEPIALSNGDLYAATGSLVNFDRPRSSSSVDRNIYKITLSDSGFGFGALFEENIVGQKVTIRVGMVDMNTGEPETAVENTLIIYGGRVDAPAYSVDTSEQGEALAVISCSSPMGDLEATRAFYTTKEAMRQRAPSDSCFDQIYQGSGTANLKWGKK